MLTDSRRTTVYTLDDAEETERVMDMLLAKKRAADRKTWLEDKGNLAVVAV